MSKRNPKLYLFDILESINAIFDYTENKTLLEFVDDRKTFNATIREFEIIGEAVKNLPEEITNQYPNIEWRDIRDFRNLLSHEYFGIDNEIVWNTIFQDLPGLKEVVNKIINKLDESE